MGEDDDYFKDDRIEGFAERAVQLGQKEKKKFLYHYTNYGGLIGICENSNIWMTYIKHLNDLTEFSHGMDLFIKKLSEKLSGPEFNTEFLKKILDFMDAEKEDPTVGIYVASFCEEEDLLSAWRGYGDGGFGVSIGIEIVDEGTTPPEETNALDVGIFNVVYCPNEQDEIVEKIISDFKALVEVLVEDNIDVNDGRVLRSLSLNLFNAVFLQSIRFKHESWKEEKEWRFIKLISKTDPHLDVRQSGRDLIAYFNLKIDSIDKFISSVTVGPRSDKKVQKEALETFKKKNKLDFEIRISEIPHR